ncbi:DUF3017 domain-containing protein [Blastococcus sp. TF02A-26]|uniref:DUF3017 domain-containing protein n=1 Tax=Blastococcus sp. TF02A-26 TaxID=2250577 RepID=UPI000DE9B99C|nr:DUF3017 domain-containing protein [Blastococcus sp. TF02A-26]RBY89902.1 hypothetical protein DQ240_03105 [Blastococcus sp. TF02A-26]
MARPPLYTRRPFLAGLLRQLPLLAVLVAVAVGLGMVALERWRSGLVVIGCALVAAALLRLLLPVRRVGLLAVRSRTVDVVLLAGMGMVLVAVALAVPAEAEVPVIQPGTR